MSFAWFAERDRWRLQTGLRHQVQEAGKDSIVQYENHVKQGRFVLVAHGTFEEVGKAQSIIAATQAAETKVHILEEAAAPK